MSLKNVYNILEKIYSTRKRTEKEQIIKNSLTEPNFTRVVKYAYDYQKKYNVTEVRFKKHEYEINLETLFQYLDFLSSKDGANNQEKLNLSILSSHDNETIEVVNRIINKDLKCGANVKTFLKYIPDLPFFELMTCQKDVNKFLKWNKNEPYYWSVKKDGVRTLNEVHEETVAQHLSRNGLEYPNFGIFDKDLIKLCKIIIKQNPELEYPFWIDGESISKKFNKIMSQIRRKTNVDLGDSKFWVFDIPLDLPFEKRYEILKKAFEGQTFDRLILLEHHLCKFTEVEILAKCADVVAKGVRGIDEGLVLKMKDSPYEFEEKSKYWCKVKPTDTLDLPVIGFEYGKPGTKYEDVIGSLVVDFNGVEVNVGSGLSDEQRYEFLDNLPKLIEVEFKEITPDGSLREPILKRIRDDKNSFDGE